MLVAVAALLSFTRSVMRGRFSSFIAMPVYTFTFTRSQPVTELLLERLQGAVAHRAVVCSTPAALKSFALKFVELLHTLDYGAMRAQESTERCGVCAERCGDVRRDAEMCGDVYE